MTFKNGAHERRREKRVSAIFMGTLGGYLCLSFWLPYELVDNSLPSLAQGRANYIDFFFNDQNLWPDTAILTQFTYFLGDFFCHQKIERSFVINHNQMPICTRDVGIFWGGLSSSIIFYFRGYNRWNRIDTFLSIFSDRKLASSYQQQKQHHLYFFIVLCLSLPLIIDGSSQLLFSSYESNHLLRIITGILFGFNLFLITIAGICARPERFPTHNHVLFPANYRLQKIHHDGVTHFQLSQKIES